MLQLDELPEPPPPSQPSKRDLPQLPQSIHLGAPQPKAHTLKVEHEDLWFGTITTDEIVFVAIESSPQAQIARSLEPAAPAAAAAKVKEVLNLDDSIFAPRKRTSDSRAYMGNNPKVSRRAFEIDWSRANQERFRKLIASSDDGGFEGSDTELKEVKEVLGKHRDLIYMTYGYYCGLSEHHEGFVMGQVEYLKWLHDAGIPDEDSKACRSSDLDMIFVTTNFEEKGKPGSELAKLNAVNDDRALMRFEFLQCLVRVAIAKYVRSGLINDVSEAVERLLLEDIEKRMPDEASFPHPRPPPPIPATLLRIRSPPHRRWCAV